MLIVTIRQSYDYFSGQKEDHLTASNLLDSWKLYKKTASRDFDYGDAWQATCFTIKHTYEAVLKPQRPHARSKEAWEAIKASNDAFKDCYLPF